MSNTGEDEELYRLLYPQPWPREVQFGMIFVSRPRLDELDSDAVRRALLKNPDAAKQKYKYPNDLDSSYPLWHAIRDGASLEILEILYNAHPEAIRHIDSRGMNILHDALSCARPFDVIRFLVDKYPEGLEKKVGMGGKTPLHNACYSYVIRSLDEFTCNIHGPDVIRLLVERYPPAVHMKDSKGFTPLGALRDEWPDYDDAGNYRLTWLDAVSEPLRAVTNADSSSQEMIAAAEKFREMNWVGGVTLVLDARPTLIHSLGLPLSAMPKMLAFVGRSCKLSTMYGATRGEPDLLQCARAVRRSKRKRRAVS